MTPNIKVGNYILKQKLGEGAFAEVRLGVHEKTGVEYAVKILERAAIRRADFERDVKREIKIMKYLRHPGIVSIHAVLVTESKMYLVMELVRGGELYEEIVKRRRVDEETARKYFQQLVDAMVYCHRRGVVHRDLKPENLLLTDDGNLKVTDFGMSWMKENIDPGNNAKMLLQTQCGTPKYMAPEIIKLSAQGYDGEKLDAWECGMVLYALLAGYLPFNGEDDNSVFTSILRGRLQFPSHFSLGARDVLTRLLEKDPAKRASLEEIREHAWFLVDYRGDASDAHNRVSSARLNHAKRGSPGHNTKGPDHNQRSVALGTERLGGSFKKSKSKSRGISRNKSRGKGCSRSGAVFGSTLEATDNAKHFENQSGGAAQGSNGTNKENANPMDRAMPTITFSKLIDSHNDMGNGLEVSQTDKAYATPARPKEGLLTVKSVKTGKASRAAKVPPLSHFIQLETDESDINSDSGGAVAPIPAINLFSLDSSKAAGDTKNDAENQTISLRDKLRSPLAAIFRSMASSQGDVGADGSAHDTDGAASSWFTSPGSPASDASPSSVDRGRVRAQPGLGWTNAG